MTRIAKRQQEAPALSFLDASTQVFREDRMLYQDYLAEQRGQQPRSRPVEKRELPAESTVQEMVAKQMFQHPTMSIMDGWQAVLKAHEGREEFNTVWECYRKYQTSAAALRDHDAAVLAKGRARP